MSEVITGMQERRASVWEQAKQLADRAADEKRDFSAEEQSQWDKLNSELNSLDRRVKDMIDGEKRAKETEEAFAKLEGGKPSEGRATRAVDDELRAFALGQSNERYYEVKPEGQEFRDLLKGTPTAGGDTVPTSFYGRLVQHLIQTSAVLQAGPTVLNTDGGEVIQIPKTTGFSTAVIINEAQTIPESDPAFGQVPVGAHKYGMIFQVSRELLADTGVDLEGFLAEQAGRALGNGFGAHMINGDGVNKPRGILLDATLGATAANPTDFGDQSLGGEGFDSLIELLHSVIPPYRASRSAAWIMNDVTLGLVRRIKTTEGAYVWQPSPIVGAPDTILGKPVVVDPFMPNPAASAKSIAFGDFSKYFVRYAEGIRYERSDDFAFNVDLVTFRALMRADARLVDTTGAIKYLQHPA